MDINTDYSNKSIDKYYLIEKLGNGSFGAVYRAKDRILKEEKALKIITVNDPMKAQQLFKEAELPYKCTHKNIVKINDAMILKFNGEKLFTIDMLLVNGGSLEKVLKHNFLPITRGLKIISETLYGLEHAHINGVIHRDIKPANILIDNRTPMLSDFGLATALNTVITPWKWYADLLPEN